VSRRRIAVLVNDFGPPAAEAGRNNVAALCTRLADRFDWLFLGMSDRDAEDAFLGHPVHRIGSPLYRSRFARDAYPVGAARLLVRGAGLLRQWRPDCVLNCMETASTGILALAMRRAAGLTVPMLQWLWTDWYELGAARGHWLTEQLPHLAMNGALLSRAALRHADGILAASRHLAARAEKAGARRVAFAPAGVDLQRFRPHERLKEEGRMRQSSSFILHPSSFILAYVGHLTWTKGASLLLEAAGPLLEQGRATLVLATAHEAEESAQVERWRGLPGVTIRGLCDPREVFAAADLTVLPRRCSYGTATYPNVVLESLACGTPVATSRLLGVDEVVRDGDNGFLLPAGDVTALRSLLESLAAGPSRLNAVAARARASVEEFDWDRAARRIGGVLEGWLP